MTSPIRYFTVFLALGSLAVFCATAFAADGQPIRIGDKLQVLCDDTTVDTGSTDAERRYHRPVCVGTVLKHDSPWEGDMCGYHNILKDEDERGVLYRMYYNAGAFGFKGSKYRYTGLKICYAESRDGINWTKPELGICEFNGSRRNNIVMPRTDNYWDNFTVMKDPNPDCPPQERYKAIALYLTPDPGNPKREKERGLLYLSSPDGVRFKRERLMFRRWQPPHKLSFDSLNVLFWDNDRKEYRLYLRSTVKIDGKPRYCHFETKPGAKEWVRTVKVMTSKDFKTWTDPVEIGVDCKGGRFDMYTNNIEPYFRNPSLYLGFPTRYSERMKWTDNYDRLCTSEWRARRTFERPGDGERMRLGLAITDAVVMWSANGTDFRVGEDAFLTPGPEFDGNWIYGSCYLARGMVETPARRGNARELSFYAYVGRFSGEAEELDRYVLRTDGFVSYHSPVEPRRLVTKPLVFEGDEMLVNFATSAYGYLKITVRGENGDTAVSHELFGDTVDRLVGFRSGELSKFSGKPVTLTFELSDADVYSYRFRKTAPAVISDGGKALFSIAVDSDAGKLDLKAADELKKHLDESTGASFEIVTNVPGRPRSGTIEVGTRRARDLVGRLRLSRFAEGECAAIYKDGSVAIAGAGDMGASYGVYLFLEKVLGCRWWAPGGEKLVPRHDRIAFDRLDIHEKQAYRFRWILIMDNAVRFHPEGRAFMLRNRLNVAEGNFPGTVIDVVQPNCHSLFHYLPPTGKEDNFRKHPEWYSMNDKGERVSDRQFCFMNKGLRAALTGKMMQKIGAYGGKGYFDVSARDVGGPFCHCAECKAAEAKYKSRGGPFFDYLFELGPAVKAKYPKAKLHFLVYRKEQTQRPPVGVKKFPDNLSAVFAPINDDFSKNYLHPNNAGTYADLKKWCGMIEVWAWYYPIPYTGYPPYLALRRLGDDTRLAMEAGQAGCCYEHDHGVKQGVNFSDLITWVTVRLYRDPSLDPMALAEEFCRGYYGAAADDMMKFVRAVEDITAGTEDYVTWDGVVSGAFTPARLVEFNRLFDRMEKTVGADPALLQRVREARIGLDIETLGKYRQLRKLFPAGMPAAEAIRDRAKNALKASVERRYPLAKEEWKTSAVERVDSFITDAYMRAVHEFKPLPARFAQIPAERIMQFYPDGSYNGIVTKTMEDAAAGFAISEPRTEENQRQYRFNFGVYDYANAKSLVRRALPYSEITPDRFKMYKVGRTRLTSPKCRYWNTYSWGMRAVLEAAWKPGVETEWEVWASLKFEGPAYSVKSEKKESAVWLDRVVLIKTEE